MHVLFAPAPILPSQASCPGFACVTGRCGGDAPAQWLRAIAEGGDRNAFAALFGHFAPRLKAYLLRLKVPPAEAEELVQDIMLAVWRKAGQFNPDIAGAAGWIFAIARNQRIDAARRARVGLPAEDPAEAPAPEPLPDAVLIAARDSERLHRAIGALPPEQASVLQLSFFDDRPHGAIERELGIPLGTVKSRLRQAMARLRQLLDDDR